MDGDFRIQESPAAEGIQVLRLHGRLDAKNAQTFVARCRELLEGGTRKLVVNLSGVGFVASSGIGILLALTEEYQDRGGTVHLVELSEAVRSVLELLNLTQFLHIFPGERESLDVAEV
jgi:anti-anti-sigma factor